MLRLTENILNSAKSGIFVKLRFVYVCVFCAFFFTTYRIFLVNTIFFSRLTTASSQPAQTQQNRQYV